jgi:hypothetical protein
VLPAGQTFPAAAEPGGRHLRHLLITDTDDAQQLCAALARMQQRAHPDTTEFALRFQRYNQLYEQQKAAQINAQARLTAFATELQVPRSSPLLILAECLSWQDTLQARGNLLAAAGHARGALHAAAAAAAR